MSFHYSPALAEASLAPSSSDGAQSAPLSASLTASNPSSSDSETDSLSTSQSGTMCRPSTGDPGVDAWISYLRDSHVSPSPRQDPCKPQTMSAICGRRRLGSFAKFDPDGYCWRTSQASLLLPMGICTPYSETWPKAGLIVNGAAYRLSQSVRPIGETDSGLWPTPYASDVKTYRLSAPGSQAHDRSLCSIMRRKENGHLSPDWTEWLMGWPMGWSSLAPMTELGSWFDETWWNEEPVPRITTDKTNRTKRLKAIGNGQVPACVVAAWHLLGVMVDSEGEYGEPIQRSS